MKPKGNAAGSRIADTTATVTQSGVKKGMKPRANQKLKHKLRGKELYLRREPIIQTLRGRKKRMKREWMLEAIQEERSKSKTKTGSGQSEPSVVWNQPTDPRGSCDEDYEEIQHMQDMLQNCRDAVE